MPAAQLPATQQRGITGKYYATVGEGENLISIPIIISNSAEDLYNACSPLHDFESSLTFEPGKPIEHDVHGAEATLAGYIRLGTHVAYIPENLEHDVYSAKPPWAARMFIHRGENYRKEPVFIPQPVYGFDYMINSLLTDAVDWILAFASDTTTYASCEKIYEGIYIDIPKRMSIVKWDIDKIAARWETQQLVTRLK